jgi:glyoxylase-like metal-dependent hydrolase (beta-lactamase superfamily II)
MTVLEDEFGDIIQKARQGLGMDMFDMASAAGVSRDILEGLESCAVRPTSNHVTALAKVLQLDGERLRVIAKNAWAPVPVSIEVQSDVIPVQGMVGPTYRVWGYLWVVDEATREAVAFDTAGYGQEMLQAVRDRDLRLKTILLTHTHRDHMGGVEILRRATGAGLCVHPAERSALDEVWDRSKDVLIADRQELRLGRRRITVRATPGHTIGGVCYHTPGVCFVGDSIFAGSIGRPYSSEGYRMLLGNVREKILGLDAATCLFPGHGPATTVGEERLHNPFFSEGRIP